jgi:hypothetical protein
MLLLFKWITLCRKYFLIVVKLGSYKRSQQRYCAERNFETIITFQTVLKAKEFQIPHSSIEM